MKRSAWFPRLILLAMLAGCGKPEFSDAEKKTIGSLALSSLPSLKADTTNRFADLPAAAALGSTLFFDQGMSRDGNVSCATCHKIDRQFQDDLPQAVGVGHTNRRTMALAGVARDPWFFWDGRRDSLWAQALTPLENPLEHAGNRAAFAHYIKKRFGERYERIFGPLPDLAAVPPNASPLGTDAEKAAWNAMPDRLAEDVNGVFANIGKAIAAFERSIEPSPTRFDRFALDLVSGAEPQGDAVFTDEELLGLKLFIGKANCVSCHNGPRFTDNSFHNTGVPPIAGLQPDRGRIDAVAQVETDPFNCFGAFRDGDESACRELRFMVKTGPELVRAYKTPSLRGAATRPPYMHSGQFSSLEEVVTHYDRAAASIEGTSELHPLDLSDRERAALVAFLKTLAE
jgi:cytochrome c peroxidase